MATPNCPQIETLKPNNSGLLLSYEAIRSRAGVISVQQKFKTAERGERVRSFSKAVDTAVQNLRGLHHHFHDKTNLIFKEDFEGDNDQLTKQFLQRMKDFNVLYKNEKLDKQIELTLKKMKSIDLTIGVLGRIKCGKSTILNALTHSNLFPTDCCNPETSVIVSVRHNNTIHKGMCDATENHGNGLKCPQLQNYMGVVVATGSTLIQEKLVEINKQSREQQTEENQHFVIIMNVPVTSRVPSHNNIVLQDTPGLGEACHSNNTYIADLAESALLSCSVYMYILDSSKMRDQLDVNALTLLKNKDSEVYRDGRLIVVANQFDRLFQRSNVTKNKRVSLEQITTNVREMVANDVMQHIPKQYVIPTSAYWAWSSRQPLEDDYELEYWKRQYEKNLDVCKDKDTSLQQFIEHISGINQIEDWIEIVSNFSSTVLQKSRLSDAVYCSYLCMDSCATYIKIKQLEAEDLASEMQLKRETWNEAVGIIYYIEEQAAQLKYLIESAYDDDIAAPKNDLLRIAEELLTDFQEKCILKCSLAGEDLDYINRPIQDIVAEYDALLDHTEEENDDESSSSIESEDDVWWDELSRSSISPTQISSSIHSELGNRQNGKMYRLLNFKKDLKELIVKLEQRLNGQLGNVRFMSIVQVIPLEELGQNKKLLQQLATVFLNRKSPHQANDLHSNTVEYCPPTQNEIAEILTSQEVSLAQLRQKSEIKKLKLGWLGRMKVWLKEKLTGNSDTKANYVMRRPDIISAINYLREINCLDECNYYLNVTLKEEIVKCYHGTYLSHVTQALKGYENQSLLQMNIMALELETEMKKVLEICQNAYQQMNYLHQCNFCLRQLKDDIKLDMSTFSTQ